MNTPRIFITMPDVIAEITEAIENGPASADDFDLDAIAVECYAYNPSYGRLQGAGWTLTADPEEFWQSVERNATGS